MGGDWSTWEARAADGRNTDIDQRTVTQQQLMQRTRELMQKYPKEIHTGVELLSSVGGNQSNAEIQYFIQGPDLNKLTTYSKTSKLPTSTSEASLFSFAFFTAMMADK